MYRVTKVLNHNAVIAVGDDKKREYMILCKGIGFGKRVSESMEVPKEAEVYSLQAATERGDARQIAREVDPVFLEIANEVLNEAEKTFGKVDRNIVFPMADHLTFAVKRIQNGEAISNPLTDDIRELFHMEYRTAQCVQPILKERFQIEIDPDEVGYIALHIHSAIQDESVSTAMQTAQAVRNCISTIEQVTGENIDVQSISYNRLMNHIRYMFERVVKKEKLKLNMNDYMSVKFPEAYEIAEKICDMIGKQMKCTLDEVEIGYLAMHIERVTDQS